jgi:hypothetical protein
MQPICSSRDSWHNPLTCTFACSTNVNEYERMLSGAAEAADEARRTWEKQVSSELKASSNEAHKDRAATQYAGISGLFMGGNTSRPGIHASAHNKADGRNAMPTASASLVSSICKSSADKRAQLLGSASGGARWRSSKARGSPADGGGRVAHEQLAEDKRIHERLEEELSNMTRTLKSNVEAMHATLVQDNAKLDQIDSDIVRGQGRLSKVNVNVDEQRIANR